MRASSPGRPPARAAPCEGPRPGPNLSRRSASDQGGTVRGGANPGSLRSGAASRRAPRSPISGEDEMLRVQDYLRSGGTIEDLAAEFGIAAYRHPRLPLVGLKYQSHAPRFDPL